ncbi:MAG: FtsQ-type POTRA domain-containing protein [Devosia nanyangense]|uniref:Cell division protein FtsQ n=1 Tax=Devosia nanyangense TaxID=1228055 RepID=A0A933NZX6_9HYPH|nr:FtsQ-type POTRA domain-containing protein [Devosia nanyangense]
MQQVGAKGFADAQLVDPRHLPVPLQSLARRTRINLGHVWILHRKLIVRAVAAGIVLVGAVGLYEARDAVVAGALTVSSLAQGEFARVGFGISEINITGQSLTSEATILKALAIAPNTSTLNFDADGALARIAAIPSVKSASIRKIYPGELSISVVEKVPMARWRIGEATYLVDEEGSPVARDDGSFRDLPLVVGEGAADDAMVMIHVLDRYPSITGGLAALSRIADRRWDLIFYSGLRVQLPENGVAQALQQLDMYQRDDQLLDRDVTVIDLRVAGMVSLKLGDLAVKARAEDAKKSKQVAKGDAEYETATERAAESKPQ